VTTPSAADRLAASLVARARGIADRDMRVAWLRATLLEAHVPTMALALDLISAAAEQAEPAEREFLFSLVQVLLDPEADALLVALREEAAGRSLLALGRLLRRPVDRPSAITPDDRIPDYGTGRPLSLGERKALARKPSRASFDKLLRDPDPAVIRNLLRNPKLTEDDVIALACRRPARADALREIAQLSKWTGRPRVRMSIVLNPSSPPDVAVPLVSLLLRHELRLVLEVTDALPAVRAAARDLLLRRPPSLGEDDEPPPDLT
jgi:hypothetical protein